MIEPGKELSDEALLRAFRVTKESDYFKSLIARYQNRLYNTAFRIVGNAWEAEEIVQETFLKALHNVNNFRTNASFSAWVYAITHNLCVDALRLRQKTKSSQSKSFDPQSLAVREDTATYNKYTVTQASDRLPGPAEQLELTEQRTLITHSLNYVPEHQRTVIVLRDIEGFSYKDIATITGINIGTVRSRLHYGREKLKELLQEYSSRKGIANYTPDTSPSPNSIEKNYDV